MQPPSDNQQISDDDREKLEEALAAALLLIYAGRRQQALLQLGVTVQTMDVPEAAARQVLAFARDRARLIQEGVNQRMSNADDPAAVSKEIDEYNRTVLQPYMESWAQHQAQQAAYSETSRPNGSTALTSKADGSPQLWTWEKQTDWGPDECDAAADASPAPYADLIDAAGSSPPVHPRCRCTLSPA
jgi:hypothetical protein